ncbi:hypothetical protein QEP16_08510 [Achromobacter insolitus]|uniref:hypothetical protein n=1 Tax=Achromobacter insolitus TaxID=217204 RepID=UPI0011EB4F6E|nr:hypothetical protein [Achromobacter insolitus]MDH3063346.1 hypothetical protein [Achromobacter insolitus]MDQ6211972.1 hypothetical protein [Achromobacter insolitus]QEK91931.1 hypothetical protein E2544_08960 [Achromobacter insolitus]
MTKPALLLVLAIALTGCSKQEETPWARLQAATPQLQLTANTPEAAVKSWWQVRDAHDRYTTTACKELAVLYQPFTSAEDSLATAELQARQNGDEKCSVQTYERSVVNVDVQSDTRAFVVAQIRNTTPSTPGFPVDNDERDRKERGVRMQYLLERADKTQNWKIAQVYGRNRYCEVAPQNGWCPLYTRKAGSANSYVYEFSQ